MASFVEAASTRPVDSCPRESSATYVKRGMTTSMLGERSGVFQGLFDGGIAGKDTAQSILPQCHHSQLDRFLFENDGRPPFNDQLAERVGDFHQLINSFAALVAGVVARVATFAVEKFAIADILFG